MSQPSLPEGHRHIVVVAFQAWGHARPLCAVVARIVKSRPLFTITLFSPSLLYDRMAKELSRHFDDHELAARARVRLIALQHNEQNFLDVEAVNISFAQAHAALVEERPVTCCKTAQEFAPVGVPDAFIVDIFANGMLDIVRMHNASKAIKVYCWISASLTALHLFWGPSSPNKDRSMHVLVQEEMRRSGQPLPEAAHTVVYRAGHEILKIPGLPPIYEYENYPQEPLVQGYFMGLMHLAGAEVINQCDGIIAAIPECFEPQEVTKDLCQWFNETGREVFVVGAMLPDTDRARDLEKKQSSQSQEIDEFMDRILREYGPKSLIYISFGSVFWSTEPVKIWTFVNVLLERKVPFIFSHASPFAKIPEDLHEKVKSSGLGLFSSWSPQQAILQHAATGWFVTHCGYNSIMESIHYGVPMICWPYQADQPMNVLLLTSVHDVAYELLEIRTGLGLKPLYRTGTAPTGTPEAIRKETSHILDLAFGEDGKKKRANVERLRDVIAAEWVENGPCQLALERLLDSF